MSVSIALNNALTGLNVNQQALTVLSQNIANANTPGYSKQSINQQSVTINGQGEGVSIQSVTRKVDEYLVRAAQDQTSQVGQASTLNDYYTKIQLLLGSPGNKNSIDSYVNTFFNSIQSLVLTPDNTTLQQSVVNGGIAVAKQFNQLAQGLNGLQFQADQDITSAINTVNIDLKNVFNLNKNIAQDTALGRSVADLEDQRDNLIRDISSYVSVKSFKKSDGSIFLTTSNGISMLDSNLYQMSYSPATSADSFGRDSVVSPITLSPVDQQGTIIGTTTNLTTSGPPSQVTTVLDNGKLFSLLNLRDKDIPNINSQLDSVAANLRDQFNAVHNAGSGYPGTNTLTGTRSVNASDYSEWSGKVRIALLDTNGQPVQSVYSDETYGQQSLNLDLSKLDSGNGPGSPSVQGIINAINQYYGGAQNKVELGNLNNVQLISDNSMLPNAAADFKFDFNLNNISSKSSNVYVTGVTVQDNLGVTMPTTSTIPSFTLNAANTYVTTAASSTVTVNTTQTNNLVNGQIIFLSTPPAGPVAGTYDGINPSALGGYFRVSNVTPTSFDIGVTNAAIIGTNYGVAGQTANPSYATAPAGGDTRTKSNGSVTADLSANSGAAFYTVTANVGVDDGSGNVVTSQISYRINNNQPSALGLAYGGLSANGAGTVINPSTYAQRVTAKLVDANGVELGKVNGQYVVSQNGFLQIQAGDSKMFLAIDSLDSKELGKPNASPSVAGTNRGFSHYFDLNDFFTSNAPTSTGDAVTGSANKLTVASRIQANNSLLSLGTLSLGNSSVVTGTSPNYTYQLTPGDNSTVAKLAAVANQSIIFSPAGGLGATTQTLSGYIGQVIGGIATNASTSSTGSANAQALLDSYKQQSSAVSGVNLDTELANTVIYQNAYAASARIITVTNQLFDSLLQSIQ